MDDNNLIPTPDIDETPEEVIVAPEDSILNTVKRMNGINEDYKEFDVDIITFTNAALGILVQIGVGPSTGFEIKDEMAVWSDIIPENRNLSMIKSYIALQVGSMFDPNQSSSIAEARRQKIAELEARINYEADYS